MVLVSFWNFIWALSVSLRILKCVGDLEAVSCVANFESDKILNTMKIMKLFQVYFTTENINILSISIQIKPHGLVFFGLHFDFNAILFLPNFASFICIIVYIFIATLIYIQSEHCWLSSHPALERP